METCHVGLEAALPVVSKKSTPIEVPDPTFKVCDEDDELLLRDEDDDDDEDDDVEIIQEDDLNNNESNDSDSPCDPNDHNIKEVEVEDLLLESGGESPLSTPNSTPGSSLQTHQETHVSADLRPQGATNLNLAQCFQWRRLASANNSFRLLREKLRRPLSARESQSSPAATDGPGAIPRARGSILCSSYAGGHGVMEDNACYLNGQRRRTSVDACGILKVKGMVTAGVSVSPPCVSTVASTGVPPSVPRNRSSFFTSLRLSRKSVSFCQRDNIMVYDAMETCVEDDGPQEPTEELDGCSTRDPDRLETGSPLPELSGKSLVPTFVFPGKRPNYAEVFAKQVLVLESLDITEDFCLMGNIRVNMTKLKAINREQDSLSKSVTIKQRASVFALYTFDHWATYKDTKAMVVRALPHPSLGKFETQAMRFYIDCDEIEVGQTVEFAVLCTDKRYTVKHGSRFTRRQRAALLSSSSGSGGSQSKDLTTVIRKYRDDNDGLFYQAKCTKKLNQWAEKAAKELKNFTPIIKYNNKNYA